MRYLGKADIAARDPALYGFQPGETGNARNDYRVVDESYTRQIPNVPQLVPPLPSAAADGGYVGGALDDALAPPPPKSGGYLKAGEGDLAMTWNMRTSAL